MTTYVEVEHLTKRYGDVVAVDDLSFTVQEGEIFGFLGPNGAGKSTTLNVLTTLTTFDSGSIRIGEHDLAKEARAIKGLTGLVPQDIALYTNLTAAENIEYFASLYGLRGKALKAAVTEALSFVGLADHARKRVAKMSGGMQRRLNIACGIAHNPRLIILDEPTVGVDAQSREHIMGSIRTLRDRGATIIYTTHYMPEAQEICDRIAIIDRGKLAAIGTEEELLEKVTDVKNIEITLLRGHSYDRDVLHRHLRAIPDVRHIQFDAHTALDQGTKDHGFPPPGADRITLDVALAFTDLSPVLKVFFDEGISIQSLTSEAPNLETTFLALTGRELR